MFDFLKRKKEPYVQSSTADWQDRWRSLVPPECRNVPVVVDGVSIEAYVLVNHFAMMLQDGLLMEASFFDVCEQKRGGEKNGSTRWLWKSPTTNFGRWISDNREASILIQHTELPDGDIRSCNAPVLGRVTWATSDDDTKMVPGRTEFQTVALPATPRQLLRWLNGESLRSISE